MDDVNIMADFLMLKNYVEAIQAENQKEDQ